MEDLSDGKPRPRPIRTVGVVYNPKKGVCSGPRDAEAEYDNIETVHAISAAIQKGGYETVELEGDRTLFSAVKEQPIDIAFNIAEGICGRGREAQVPAMLNVLGIPFTGSDETALAIALDKALTKRLLSTFGIRTPAFAVVSSADDRSLSSLRFPVILKPDAEGSSKGVVDKCVAFDPTELHSILGQLLKDYREPVLVEEYIEGREFTVGILGNGADARVFAPMEIRFRRSTGEGLHVYSYSVKQKYKEYVDYECPARLTDDQDSLMRSSALRAFSALSCCDFSRVDFRMSAEGEIYFIEINPLPGLAPGYSDYPMLAEFQGVSYEDLVLGVLHAGLKRLGLEENEK